MTAEHVLRDRAHPEAEHGGTDPTDHGPDDSVRGDISACRIGAGVDDVLRRPLRFGGERKCGWCRWPVLPAEHPPGVDVVGEHDGHAAADADQQEHLRPEGAGGRVHAQAGRHDDRGGRRHQRQQSGHLGADHGDERAGVGRSAEAVPGDHAADGGDGHREAEQDGAQRLVEAEVLRIGHLQAQAQHQGGHDRHGEQRAPEPRGPTACVAPRLGLQPGGAGQQVERGHPERAQHAVGSEPAQRAAVEDAPVLRQAAEDGADHQALAERHHQRGDAEQPPPTGSVVRCGALHLQSQPAQHEGQQHHDQREVDPGEHGGVDAGQRRPEGHPGEDDPALVGVPGRRDQLGVLLAPLVAVVEEAEDPDPEVVAVQHEVRAECEQDQRVGSVVSHGWPPALP